ncbi:hypothetical protein [Paraburkholderia sediminicola]|uniref:hypothetical protein n=1 Tax=Paraburkholderia sediminicola TaxID=458836 RepID=UPI0038B80DAE
MSAQQLAFLSRAQQTHSELLQLQHFPVRTKLKNWNSSFEQRKEAKLKTTRTIRAAAVAVAATSLTACSTYSVSRYSVSADDVVALRSLPPNSVSVGAFTSPSGPVSEITCRAVGPIKTPDGETYADFVRKALISELKMAGAYSDTAPTQITGVLNKIDFSSNSGMWNLDLSLTSTNNRSLSVTEAYPFTSSFYGETACNQTAQALMPAVQDLIGKAVQNPGFPAMLAR